MGSGLSSKASISRNVAVHAPIASANDRMAAAEVTFAFLSDYWANRFGQNPKVVGQTFRMGNQIYEIVGVAEKPFTGTEPGVMTDIFVPTMMHPDATRPDSTWVRIFVLLKPGVEPEQVRAMLFATSRTFEADRAKRFKGMSQQAIDNYVNQAVILERAPSGASGFQTDNRASLAALGVLVGLVLLIACANVANLMTAQAAARAREMALRISIGAGRSRLVQLILVESGMDRAAGSHDRMAVCVVGRSVRRGHDQSA